MPSAALEVDPSNPAALDAEIQRTIDPQARAVLEAERQQRIAAAPGPVAAPEPARARRMGAEACPEGAVPLAASELDA